MWLPWHYEKYHICHDGISLIRSSQGWLEFIVLQTLIQAHPGTLVSIPVTTATKCAQRKQSNTKLGWEGGGGRICERRKG